MGKIMGVISCNHRLKKLEGLTNNRPIAALPFGGRYRLLDFALSNMVNSGIRTVGIITPYHYRPILDHIGAGKEWSLDRKTGGLFVLPGVTHGIYPRNNKFALKDIMKNVDFLERDHTEYIVICGCSNIFNLDFRQVVQHHEASRVDITLLYKELTLDTVEDLGEVTLETDGLGHVIEMNKTQGKEGQQVKYFADVFILKRSFLLDIIKGYQNIEYLDILDIIEENFSYVTLGSYPINGYFGNIYSMLSYFQRSMELLQPAVQKELFSGDHRVITRIRDNPPTKYGPGSTVQESLISSGCIIQGNVSGSIIFRGVHVEEGAKITNCILMQKCTIGKESVLENVIIDKYNFIHPHTVIKGEARDPVVINKHKAV
jgi:glucose-1-phosphate adenylyltransferase